MDARPEAVKPDRQALSIPDNSGGGSCFRSGCHPPGFVLDYIRSRAYLAPSWPEEYWPARDATATPEQFALTVEGFRSDHTALYELVADPATDLLTTIPSTPGHTILREVHLVGDHNAYHVGELAILRQVMGIWPPGREE